MKPLREKLIETEHLTYLRLKLRLKQGTYIIRIVVTDVLDLVESGQTCRILIDNVLPNKAFYMLHVVGWFHHTRSMGIGPPFGLLWPSYEPGPIWEPIKFSL